MPRRTFALLLVLVLGSLGLAGSTPEEPKPPVVLDAKDDEAKKLLDDVAKAVAEKNDLALANCIGQMETLKHATFVPVIRAQLKATSPDVLAAAIRAAASHELKDTEKDVRKILHTKPAGPAKKGADDRLAQGAVNAAIADYLTHLDIAGEEATVLDENLVPLLGDEQRLKAPWAKDLCAAAIHYFGKRRFKKAVPLLVEMIDRPAPKNPNDPKNPPESFWHERVTMLEASESWVRWALKEITGQEFRLGKEWQEWLAKNHKDYK